MTEWQIKNKKIFFTRKLFIVLISRRLRQMNTDYFLWGHGDKYSAHGCYFWTRINRIERIVPCGRHFHPSASNCCYCNRKSVKICAICGSINLKRYFLKNIIPHGWKLPLIKTLPQMINFILPQIPHRFMFYPENGVIEYQKWL